MHPISSRAVGSAAWLRGVSVVGYSTATTNKGASLTVTKPTGVIDGDLLIAVMVVGADSNRSWTTTGWTDIVDNGAEPSMAVVRKVASSEGANWTFTQSGAQVNMSALVMAFRNATWDTAGSQATSADGADSVTATTVTTATDRALLLAVFARALAWDTKTPNLRLPGMTKLASVEEASRAGIAVFGQTITAAGATGSRTFTQQCYDSGRKTAGILLSIKRA